MDTQVITIELAEGMEYPRDIKDRVQEGMMGIQDRADHVSMLNLVNLSSKRKPVGK